MLTGGGTAGHITPLLAVANELLAIRKGDIELHFIGQKGDKNANLVIESASVIKMHYIQAGKYRRFHNLTYLQRLLNIKVHALNIIDAFKVFIGFFQALYTLMRIKPVVMFAKGGFVVVPVGWACKLLRIHYITHDSDTIPGLANKMIAKGATKNAVAHAGVKAYPDYKTVVTGIPLSSEYDDRRDCTQQEYKLNLGIPSDSIMLFIFTGTQGAQVIDKSLEGVIPNLLNTHKNLYVVHVFGRLNESTLSSQYASADSSVSERIRKLSFIDNAYDYMAAADIIIGRAGATSTAEIATIGRASIIIPADKLTGGHQLKNAEVLAKAKASIIVLEENLESSLSATIESLIFDEKLRLELSTNIAKLATPNAAKVLANLILQVGGCDR